MQQRPAKREPIFNVPGIVLVLLGSFVAVHVVRAMLPVDQDNWWTLALAFIPSRFGEMMEQLPGGAVSAVTSWWTHAFVHGDNFHLAINSAWMLAFGSALARRLGTARFLAFSAVCTALAAAAFLANNIGALAPMVGASGAIAGLMGGTMRFLFSATGGPRPRDLHDNIQAVPRLSLSEALQDRRVVLVTLGWIVLNIVIALGASALTSAGGIAWEAHVGGYLAGLLLFGLFDPGRSTPYSEADYTFGPGDYFDDGEGYEDERKGAGGAKGQGRNGADRDPWG